MNVRLLRICLTISFFISSTVFAAESVYRCEVLSDAHIKNNGELVIVQDSPRVGQEFAVIRKTGEVVGDVMDALRKPKIIASGSASDAYKVIWVQKSSSKNGAFK
jgi:hypothetical protein